jgi:hypothetical protein
MIEQSSTHYTIREAQSIFNKDFYIVGIAANNKVALAAASKTLIKLGDTLDEINFFATTESMAEFRELVTQ